jgi:ankyrin repeat protein
VKALIEAGADLNAKDTNGFTALHGAAFYGELDCEIELNFSWC